MMLILLSLLVIGASASDGWTAVQLETDINFDLENSPLQIRTDSTVGSNEQVGLSLLTAGGENAGGVTLHFSSSPEYRINYCMSDNTNFLTDLPNETDKTWTITLTRTPGTVRFIIQCNNKEVLNVVLSDTTCARSDWSSYWSRNVEKIEFLYSDSASDYYRPGCSAGNYITKDKGCQQCEENTYSGQGASECTSCPDGKISEAGSTLESDCKDDKKHDYSGALLNSLSGIITASVLILLI